MADVIAKFGANADGAMMTECAAKNAYETKKRIHAAIKYATLFRARIKRTNRCR